MAAFCLATRMTPEVYWTLTPSEVSAFVKRHNKINGK